MRVIAMTIATTTIKKPASVRLSARLNSALNQQAKQLKISKDALVRRALEDKLEELQDIADAEIMLARIKSGKEKTFTLDEVRKELGL
jgi:RHH-type transcriptional regulator, rel operon repressor / antitoxin RelB